jgi:hypothetical protein
LFPVFAAAAAGAPFVAVRGGEGARLGTAEEKILGKYGDGSDIDTFVAISEDFRLWA